MKQEDYHVSRNTCPRNCYSTCSILSYVKKGKLYKVEGDPKHGYTLGRLCSKGYALPQYVYHPERLRYPMRQFPRGSGRWERIDWNEALEIIAEKILELNSRYGSNLAIGYNKYSGNLGVLRFAVEGFFQSIGPHTRPIGDLCQAAGYDAQLYDFGKIRMPDAENMARARQIVLWGVNPAVTAVHQWFFINRARDLGAKLIVIDPLFTSTAAQGDIYIQVKPGTDGMLALAAAKILVEEGLHDESFLLDKTEGWPEFQNYLKKEVSLKEASRITGVSVEAIRELALAYKEKQVVTWIGFGLQRHINGGQNIRAIDALATLSGQIGLPGGGVYYVSPKDDFPLAISNMSEQPASNRELDISVFPLEALKLIEPPLKLLWIACRNPLSQDPQPQHWFELFQRLELVVTVDLFMTETASYSDLVLPAASFFEDYDLNFSYWHNWVSINEKAIENYYEAKSDLEIARLLAIKLNQLSPGFSSFPHTLTALDWIGKELTPEIKGLLGISHWRELLKGPRRLNLNPVPWKDGIFATPSGKYEFYSSKALERDLPALPKYVERCSPHPDYPLQLLTPRQLNQIHSQYGELPWLKEKKTEGLIYLHPEAAEERGIEEGDWVDVFNARGTLLAKVAISPRIPKKVVVLSDAAANKLVYHRRTDMGKGNAGRNANAYYSAYVDLRKYQGGCPSWYSN